MGKGKLKVQRTSIGHHKGPKGVPHQGHNARTGAGPCPSSTGKNIKRS